MIPRLLVIPLLGGLIVLAALAAASTPVASPVDACNVQPRTPEEIDRLLAQATPDSEDEVSVDTILEADLPTGKPAAPSVNDDIARLLATQAACIRELDALRFYALYTDRYLGALIAFEGYTEWKAQFGAPAPMTAVQPDYRVGSVDQMVELEDERVAALVTFIGADIEDSHPAPGVTYLMIFEMDDGEWRIDQQYSSYFDSTHQEFHVVAELLDEAATPAP